MRETTALGRRRGRLDYYMHDESAAFRFKLAGDLTEETVTDLEQARRTASSVMGGRKLIADLTAVTSVDAAGRALLAEWHGLGARLTVTSPQAQARMETLTGMAMTFGGTKPGAGSWLPRRAAALWLGIAATLITGAGCSNATSAVKPPQPLTVEVSDVVQKDVPLYREWIGTLDGYVNADIKAQVSGYLVQQEYTEGTFIKAGQLLFQIDPRPFQASLGQAEGQLAQTQGQLQQAQAQLLQAEAQVAVAEANQRRVQLDVDRYTPLAQQQAITQQDLDNATQNNMAAKAQLQAAKAAVETAKAQIVAVGAAVEASKAAAETARINLGFTRLTSPIDGIPGIAQMQVGALVSAASGPITTVSTVDPIKVNFTASEQEYLEYTRRFPTAEKRQANNRLLELELILADGTVYPHKGKFYFADRQVDVRTGAIRLVGLFPNPGNSLRPGQYGRVRTAIQMQPGALLVPQQAVIDLQGSHEVAVVDDSNKVSIRPVSLGETVGTQWIVRDGVKPGERVIVAGVQKVRQGMQVDPKPAGAR